MAVAEELHSAGRRTQQAATGKPGLVLAVKAGTSGELLTKLLDAYAAEPGAVAVDLRLCESPQQHQLLRDGEADAALLHLPFDPAAGFDTESLGNEGQVAIPAPEAADRRRRNAETMATWTSVPPFTASAVTVRRSSRCPTMN